MELRISILSSGDVLLNGVAVQLATIQDALEKTDRNQDSVLYYREAPQAEPPPQAAEVLKLIVGNKLPVSFSSLPDFSDYVDRFGQSHPRPAQVGPPVATDPIAPRMPDVDLRRKPEDVFAEARKSASTETGAGSVAIVRPDRAVLAFPKLSSVPKITNLSAVPDLIHGGLSRDVAAIVNTEFTMLHNTAPPSIEEAVKGIPFLHLLMGWAYSGHRVWAFEGHPSALPAGLADREFLILDSGMLPFLQSDWMAVAQRSMKPGGKVFLYHREKWLLAPLVPSSRPQGWRYSAPDGEASYANCLLETLAKGSAASVAIDSGGPVPDLAGLATDPEESNWVAALPFSYGSLDAGKVIAILLNLAARGKAGTFEKEWILSAKVASQDREPILQTFVFRRQRKLLRTILHVSKL